MQTWIVYAILSMVFAGVTAILAKVGLQNVHADLGLGVRTAVIFFIIMAINIVDSRYKELSSLTTAQVTWLVLSGVTIKSIYRENLTCTGKTEVIAKSLRGRYSAGSNLLTCNNVHQLPKNCPAQSAAQPGILRH